MKQLNKQTVFLFLLILCLCYGGSGGNHEPIRILTILLSPWAIAKLQRPSFVFLKPIIIFLICWLCYMIISLIWSLDASGGLKEIIYYVIHFLLFIEIIVFSKQCNNRLEVISLGWMFAFFLTSLVAIWEIRTGQHLESALKDSVIRIEGQSYQIFYAAANFGNYNTYCVFICFTLPFCFYGIIQHNKTIRLLGVIAIVIGTVILFFNASRGALIALIIMMAIFVMFNINLKRKSNKRILLFLSIALLLLFIYYGPQMMAHINLRMEAGSGFKDNTRIGLWIDALDLFFNSWGFGVGVGSLAESMRMIGHIITHNVLVEILIQFGLVITIIIICFFFKIFLRFYHCPTRSVKLVGYCAIIAFPFYGIIDSSYLLKPQIWVFMASLYMFSNYKLFSR